MIPATYENVQVAERLAPAIRAWLGGLVVGQHRMYAVAMSDRPRTYVKLAQEMGVSAGMIRDRMHRLERSGLRVLCDGLKDLGLPDIEDDYYCDAWSVLVALQAILDVGEGRLPK